MTTATPEAGRNMTPIEIPAISPAPISLPLVLGAADNMLVDTAAELVIGPSLVDETVADIKR